MLAALGLTPACCSFKVLLLFWEEEEARQGRVLERLQRKCDVKLLYVNWLEKFLMIPYIYR